MEDDDDSLVLPSLECNVPQPTDEVAAAAYSETEDDEDDDLQASAKSHPSDVDKESALCIQRSETNGHGLDFE